MVKGRPLSTTGSYCARKELRAVLQAAQNAEIWNSNKLRYLQTIF